LRKCSDIEPCNSFEKTALFEKSPLVRKLKFSLFDEIRKLAFCVFVNLNLLSLFEQRFSHLELCKTLEFLRFASRFTIDFLECGLAKRDAFSRFRQPEVCQLSRTLLLPLTCAHKLDLCSQPRRLPRIETSAPQADVYPAARCLHYTRCPHVCVHRCSYRSIHRFTSKLGN
jgi:hypothetical protein